MYVFIQINVITWKVITNSNNIVYNNVNNMLITLVNNLVLQTYAGSVYV